MEEDIRSPRISDELRREFASAATEYHQQLRGSEAERYLKEVRGFTDEAINHFNLGYVEIPRKTDSMHQGRITIPYQTRTGIVAMRSRSMPLENGGEEGTKYLPWMAGAITRPFNTPALDTAAEVYICEGEFDTITAQMCGVNAVGIAGSTNWKNVYRPLFRFRKVTVVIDKDDDGQSMKWAKEISKAIGGAAIVAPEDGYDLNSYFMTFGRDMTRKMLGLDQD